MMKKTAVLLLAMSSLFAAVTVHAACDVQLSETLIDYGEMTRGTLLSRPENALSATELLMGDERETEISVICDRDTPITLAFSGPAHDTESYQLGDQGQGRVTLTLHDVTLDDRPVIIESAGKQAAQMAFSAGTPMRFLKDGQVASGTTLRGKVTFATWVTADASRVRDSQQWQLNGSFTVSSEG